MIKREKRRDARMTKKMQKKRGRTPKKDWNAEKKMRMQKKGRDAEKIRAPYSSSYHTEAEFNKRWIVHPLVGNMSWV